MLRKSLEFDLDEEALSELTLAVAQNSGAFTLSWMGCLLGAMDNQKKSKRRIKQIT